MLILYDKKSSITWRNNETTTAEEIAGNPKIKGLVGDDDCVLIQNDKGQTLTWRYLNVLKSQYGVEEADPEKALEEIKSRWGYYDKQAIQDAFLATAPQVQAEQDAAICELYELIEGSAE